MSGEATLRGARSAARLLGSLPVLGFVLLTFSVIFPPLDDTANLDLSTHMGQHILIIISGVMLGHYLYKRGTFSRVQGQTSAKVSLLVVCALGVFWHIPGPFDAAIFNPWIHAAEHVSFLVLGILVGSLVREISSLSKIFVLLLTFFVHFAYAYALISPYQIYPPFSLSDQATMGLIMFSAGPGYWVGILYLASRHPEWYGGKQAVEEPKRVQLPARLRWVAPALTVTLLILLIGFFAAAGLAIGLGPAQKVTSGPTVYILETPVTWNYSPQQLTVVVGHNSTVTWVSHSLSFDTITSTNGVFSSGNIAPGQTFQYTFTQPGTYRYYCVYHPWMVGQITVLP